MSNRLQPDLDPLLKLSEVRAHRARTATASIYRMVSEGEFPAPSEARQEPVGWRLSDIHHWIDSRPQPLAATGQVGVAA